MLIACVLAAAASTAVPTFARADPIGDPCSLAIVMFCRFLPMAPDLDHDIDLTQQYPKNDPGDPPPESLPPADICP